jgi:Fur family transcriptional regulator, peroxide stress response regulator
MMQDTIKQQLTQVQISPSFTRVKILEFLKNVQHHPTVDDIYQRLVGELPTLSKTTVYNVLNLFEEKQLVKSLIFDKAITRYELIEDQHAHFQCKDCGNVFDIPSPKVVLPRLHHGFTVVEEEVLLKGLCPDCSQK